MIAAGQGPAPLEAGATLLEQVRRELLNGRHLGSHVCRGIEPAEAIGNGLVGFIRRSRRLGEEGGLPQPDA